MALGLNLLVRLGRQVLKGPVVDSGLLPASCYRHLTLAAMEKDDFPGALEYLQWAEDPLLAQLLILRLRLLAAKHGQQRQGLVDLLRQILTEERRQQYQDLLFAEDRALELLGRYEAQALASLT
jgi:hypothetical protein